MFTKSFVPFDHTAKVLFFCNFSILFLVYYANVKIFLNQYTFTWVAKNIQKIRGPVFQKIKILRNFI